ncbi:non-ribosomal peptide synthetase [Winslowiella iniecta]|uniref:Peptide synthetase n=1 Tax=Winslowiella iniecta TaxID=1560201 RepID=A0A0L7SXB6_9GAMM|nr:non-ribosomal peptide synthetase [Winslowiella iniecta]KOC87586.1 peptide synthetase [Winslowiella iniecta]KOC90375.1 peptide synthetase [Winslowiella iniecta]
MSVYPLTTVQQAVWIDQLLTPDIPCYNIGGVWQIHHHVELKLFQQAIAEIMQQHDALKFILSETEQGIVQTISHIHPMTFSHHDFSLSEDALNSSWKKLRQLFIQPFTLYDCLLWRCHVIKVSGNLSLWLINAHHLIADGSSIALLSRLIFERYKQLLNGKPLTVLPGTGYGEFIAYDRHYLASPRYQLDRDFWLNRFEDFPPSALERRQGYGEEKTWPSSQIMRNLPLARYQQLGDYAERHGASVMHFMTALLACCLGRLWQVDDITLGLPIHNRNGARFKQTLGMFSSMIPLRLMLDAQQPFPALMQQVATELRRCYRHQRFPIAELNRHLRLGQRGRRQLFDLSFSQEIFLTDIDIDGGELKSAAMHHGYEQTPLSLYLRHYHQAEDPSLEFHFNQAWFSDQDADRLASRILHLLEAVLDAPSEQPVALLPLLLPQEQQQILQCWNNSDRHWPLPLTIQQFFEQQAARTPDAIALCGDSAPLSYARLNHRANQLAWFLRSAGLTADDRVALCVERGTQMVIALLGILKAGAAYVPLDPDYPQDRLRHMLQDCGATCVLVDDAGQRALQAMRDDCPLAYHLFHDLPQWQQQSIENPPPLHGDISRTLAYVIYTSGSTGRPKGVMIEHRAVINRLMWMQHTYQLSPQDTVLQKTPFSFDVSVWEFFWPLMIGARLALAKAGGHQDPAYISELIAAEQVTTLHFVPSMLQLFLRYGEMTACRSLKRIFCSGEALPLAAVERCHQQLPAAELHNLYGPTEAAIDVSYWHCQPEDRRLPVPIGYPVANTRLYILDHQQQLLPAGVRGELYIGGIQLARGYLNLPALTAERFIADPFSDDPQARMYKTGDVARWREDGSVEYLGRNDFQLKIHGLRIEAGEIEQQICGFPQIADAVVMACDRHDGNQWLVAWVITPPQPDLTERLRTHLRATLPEYMLPGCVVALEAFPLSANGKLDRTRLPLPQLAVPRKAFCPPANDQERQLADWWQSLLGVEQVDRDDDFFALGGHSLHAIQLLLLLKREGISAEMKTLFIHPTLQAQARAIHQHQATSPAGIADITPAAMQKLLRQLNQPADNFVLIQPLNTALTSNDLWMIHPAVVGCEIYRDLARALTGHFNAIGVNNYNLFNHPHISALPALASYYLQHIWNYGLPRHKTVRLLGWSLGGIIALEIAAQLEQRGFNDIHVFLLDSLYQTEVQQHIVPGMLAPILAMMGITGEAARRGEQVEKTEININNQCLSAPLRHSKVTLFKATEFVDLSVAGGVDGREILAIADNGLAQVCPQLEVIPLAVNHHSIILCHQEITDALTQPQYNASSRVF